MPLEAQRFMESVLSCGSLDVGS